MSEVVISVTDAARNFSDCVNRVRYQGTTFLLQKNGVSVARIVPEERKPCTGLELAEALADVHLTPEERKPRTGKEIAAALRVSLEDVRLGKEEATDWLRDLEEARKNLIPPVDKWQF
jgi:antitoxin (DNA-binding transcriptional repressor) of toxin-antitoxin stability system